MPLTCRTTTRAISLLAEGDLLQGDHIDYDKSGHSVMDRTGPLPNEQMMVLDCGVIRRNVAVATSGCHDCKRGGVSAVGSLLHMAYRIGGARRHTGNRVSRKEARTLAVTPQFVCQFAQQSRKCLFIRIRC